MLGSLTVGRISLTLAAGRRLRTKDGIDVWPLEVWLDAVARAALWP